MRVSLLPSVIVLLLSSSQLGSLADEEGPDSVTLTLQVDGARQPVTVGVAAPPLASARDLCASKGIAPSADPSESCETLVSSEIHRLQTERLARGSSTLGGSDVPHAHRLDPSLSRYFLRARELELWLGSAGFSVAEGHVGLVGDKVAYLSRLAASPLIRTVVQVGMNAGHSAVLFLEANPRARVLSVDSGFHAYTAEAARALGRWYPGRHALCLKPSQQAWQEAQGMAGGNGGVGGASTPMVVDPACAFPDQGADLVLVDGDHSYTAARFDLLGACSAAAWPSRVGKKREGPLVAMDDVGRGCHFQPVDGMYSTNSCDASRAWQEATAEDTGWLLEVGSMEAFQDHRVSGMKVGRCLRRTF